METDGNLEHTAKDDLPAQLLEDGSDIVTFIYFIQGHLWLICWHII